MASDTEAARYQKSAAGVWLIAGPTASGKSALALALAERLDGEVVNADALQLYGDLSIISARPTAAETGRAPHHLYGVADAAERWSVGRWLRAALPAIAAVRARGRTPVVVGGTGLYFAALTRGLAETPPVEEAVRAAAQARLEALGEAAFRAGLARTDPRAEARIFAGDRQRLVRAAAVAEATGRPLSAWLDETRPALPPGAWSGVVLEPSRADLYARCDARMEAMIAAGAVEEAAALDRRVREEGLAADLPVLKAVGLRELAAAARGEASLHAAREAAARETRRYAKRQSTWFRNQTPDWRRIVSLDPATQAAQLLALSRAGDRLRPGSGEDRT